MSKLRGTGVAIIVAGCVLVGSVIGSINNGYFTRQDREHTTQTTTEEPEKEAIEETAVIQPETTETTETTTEEATTTTVADEVETFSDSSYTKSEFISLLSQATGANSIEMEDAGIYLVRNRVGWSNVTNSELYNYNDFIVDGKVIYRSGYDIVSGTRVDIVNDDNLYDTYGTNFLFFIGDETTIESRRTVNREGLFEALEFDPEFVSNFTSTPENFDAEYSLLDPNRKYHYIDTKVLGINGGLKTERQEYLIDDEVIYGVIRDVSGSVESTYGTYSSNYQKGY